MVQRVSKVPQPVGKSALYGEEVPAISTLLAGTIIAENVPEVRALFFEGTSSLGKCPFDLDASV